MHLQVPAPARHQQRLRFQGRASLMRWIQEPSDSETCQFVSCFCIRNLINALRGNTCFMNSALQCLAHTKELTDYFLSNPVADTLFEAANTHKRWCL